MLITRAISRQLQQPKQSYHSYGTISLLQAKTASFNMGSDNRDVNTVWLERGKAMSCSGLIMYIEIDHCLWNSTTVGRTVDLLEKGSGSDLKNSNLFKVRKLERGDCCSGASWVLTE